MEAMNVASKPSVRELRFAFLTQLSSLNLSVQVLLSGPVVLCF